MLVKIQAFVLHRYILIQVILNEINKLFLESRGNVTNSIMQMQKYGPWIICQEKELDSMLKFAFLAPHQFR